MSLLRPLYGVTRTEIRLQWRRRTLLLYAGLVLVTLVAGTYLLFGQDTPVLPGSSPIPIQRLERISNTTRVSLGVFPILMVITLFTLPILAAESVPVDSATGMRPVLDSLPVSTGMVLLGKVLALFILLLLELCALAALHGATGWILYGPFDVGEYLRVWLFGILPLTLFSGGMAVLLASGQKERRRAILVALVFGLYQAMALPLKGTAGQVWDTLAISRPSFLFELYSGQARRLQAGLIEEVCSPPNTGTNSTDPGLEAWCSQLELSNLDIWNALLTHPPMPIRTTLIACSVQGVLVWLLAWAWRNGREGRE